MSMKRYVVGRDGDMYDAETGDWFEGSLVAEDQWIPAEVAQGLYDALSKIKRRIDSGSLDEWTISALVKIADEALDAADGNDNAP